MASQARDHALTAAVTSIGPGTVEQLTSEVVRLGRAYVSGSPLPLFTAMHQALSRVRAALDQKAYPSQSRDLLFLAGALCGLMANASLDLGREDAADDLARAAWTYGSLIDHAPLAGWARGTQALAAIWDHRYADAVGYADDGLTRLPSGTGAARLHAIRARALAGHRDFTQARSALKAASEAASSQHADPFVPIRRTSPAAAISSPSASRSGEAPRAWTPRAAANVASAANAPRASPQRSAAPLTLSNSPSVSENCTTFGRGTASRVRRRAALPLKLTTAIQTRRCCPRERPRPVPHRLHCLSLGRAGPRDKQWISTSCSF